MKAQTVHSARVGVVDREPRLAPHKGDAFAQAHDRAGQGVGG